MRSTHSMFNSQLETKINPQYSALKETSNNDTHKFQQLSYDLLVTWPKAALNLQQNYNSWILWSGLDFFTVKICQFFSYENHVPEKPDLEDTRFFYQPEKLNRTICTCSADQQLKTFPAANLNNSSGDEAMAIFFPFKTHMGRT